MLTNHGINLYVPYKQQEFMRQADNYRLAQKARAGRRPVAFRLYYRALAGFGHWLVVSGHRLQKRYGNLPDLTKPVHKPVPSNRRA